MDVSDVFDLSEFGRKIYGMLRLGLMSPFPVTEQDKQIK